MKTVLLILPFLMRSIITALLFVIVLSCKNSVQNQEVNPVASIDSVKANLTIEQSISTNFRNSLYIDILQKFIESEDYFLNLNGNDEYSESTSKELIDSNIGVINQSFEEARIKLNKETVSKYMAIDNIETLFVFNDHQEIIDSITLSHYEYYDAMIEASFVATYKGAPDLENKIAISKPGFDNVIRRKSPVFVSDSTYFNLVFMKNGFEPDLIYGSGYTTYFGDTIAFLSFSDYKRVKDCLYLLKNGIATDSIINDYVIKNMIPVPIANDSVIFYVSEAGVPGTDSYWTILTGIDLKSNRLEFYSKNRYEVKPLLYRN
jgi:hypothetical protein